MIPCSVGGLVDWLVAFVAFDWFAHGRVRFKVVVKSGRGRMPPFALTCASNFLAWQSRQIPPGNTARGSIIFLHFLHGVMI